VKDFSGKPNKIMNQNFQAHGTTHTIYDSNLSYKIQAKKSFLLSVYGDIILITFQSQPQPYLMH
jgi:hypothetical protein